MADMPAGTVYGRLVGNFQHLVEDGSDANDLPDLNALPGTIEVKPSIPYVIHTNPDTGVDTVIVLPAETYSIGKSGSVDIRVVSTESPNLSVTGWTWNIKISLRGYDALTTSVSVPAGATVSIPKALGSPKVTGSVVVKEPGTPGPANNLTVASTKTGAAGTPAEVTISGTAPSQSLEFTIPEGKPGVDGTSPEIHWDGDQVVINGTPGPHLANTQVIPGGVVPFFAARDRYFSPITYWWADFWTTNGNWERTLANPDVLGPLIVNINNGAGTAPDQDWQRQIEIARSRGAKVLGYVSTQYGKRGESEILADIAKHVEYYNVDGIFIDEMTNGVGDNEKYVPQYKALNDKIKADHGNAFWTVGNPGTSTSEDVLACADTIVVYESDAAYYLNPQWDIHPSYYSRYPSTKFWHVIHSVTDKDQAKAVIAAASTKYRPAFLFLTDAQFNNGASNPYGVPPSQWLIDMQVQWARHQPLDGFSTASSDVRKDTGKRDITALVSGVSSGSLFIRRTDSLVVLEADDLVFGDLPTSGVPEIPSIVGFTPTAHYPGSMFAQGSGPVLLERLAEVLRFTGSTPALHLQDSITFLTEDAWPTTLPGSPA